MSAATPVCAMSAVFDRLLAAHIVAAKALGPNGDADGIDAPPRAFGENGRVVAGVYSPGEGDGRAFSNRRAGAGASISSGSPLAGARSSSPGRPVANRVDARQSGQSNPHLGSSSICRPAGRFATAELERAECEWL